MAASSITRALAIDPRADNPKTIEFYVNAGCFLRDAVCLRENATCGPIYPIHALALKSFLHLNGQSLKNLRLTFGHDLELLLAEAHKTRYDFSYDAIGGRCTAYRAIDPQSHGTCPSPGRDAAIGASRSCIGRTALRPTT